MVREFSFFIKRKIVPGFKLKKNDIVIDIGSGDKPFWRGNVFLDKLSLKNLHRHTDTKTIKSLGVFVDSDISKTKFKDKAFDFSFCAHLLEHVENPGTAIDEIVRISKKGYIEVPNGVIESMSPFHSHLWFIFQNGSKLIFVRKSAKMHEILKENGKKYYLSTGKLSEPFIRLYWKGSIDYEVIDDDKTGKYFPPSKTPRTEKNPTLLTLSTYFYNTIIALLRTIYQVDNNVDIKKLLKD